MNPLREVLEHLVSRLNLRARVREEMAVSLWSEVAGPTVARHTRALRVRGGYLVVACSGPAWAYELSFWRRQLVTALNRRIGAAVVRDVRFEVGSVPETGDPRGPVLPFATGQEETDRPDMRPLPPEDMDMAAALGRQIADEGLRERFVTFFLGERRRRRWRMDRGWGTCPCCGALRERGSDMCPVCRQAWDGERVRSLAAALRRRRRLTYEVLKEEIPDLSPQEFQRFRARMLRLARRREGGDSGQFPAGRR